MKCVSYIALILMVVGSLNWGLVGFFNYNLVGDIFGGAGSGFSRFIFALVGLAGVYGIRFLFHCCNKNSCCNSGCKKK